MPASSSTSSSTQTPAVRTFQMDGSSQGNLASSVNLFRGDVNLSQTLFTLPGRSQSNALDVILSVQYQSNVFRAATTWNADAPTGVLGLGWQLPLTWIEALDQGAPASGNRAYTLYDNGSANQLVRQSIVPMLFCMEGSLAGGLENGMPVPTAIRAQFLEHGLALSVQTKVAGAAPEWTLDDADLQQQFVLKTEGSALNAYDGGELYQLQNYQFWKILYYPDYERWLIVSDQAVRRSFGGQTANTPEGFATANDNSIAWSVWWTNESAAPVWKGASNQTSGQIQVARAWYLNTMEDRFGSRVTFRYNRFTRNQQGYLPEVEQRVGVEGKPYTKAVYLSQIEDSYGRKVNFHYESKLWEAAAESPREYYDPHSATPSNDPSPYQDCYETFYLDLVTVDDAAGQRMFSLGFDFAPSPSSPVANVTDFTGELKGNTYKRFLTGIIQYNQDGTASPGLRFDYDLAMNTQGGQPGALKAVTYPQGGVARYTYSNDQQLVLAERSIEVSRPAQVSEGATPRVFFGGDYAVVCYYNQNSQELSLQVLTWTGSWLIWQLSADSPLIDTQGLDLETLNVQTGADFLTLRFNRTSGDLAVYVFERDSARPGQWRAATIHQVTTALNTPTLSYASTNAAPTFVGGSTFFVVSQMDASSLTGSYEVLTWRWSSQSWETQTVSAATYSWLTAGNDYYVVLDRNGSFSLFALDSSLQWKNAGALKLDGMSVVSVDDTVLVPGSSLVVVTNRTSANSQQNTYQQWILDWDSDYQLTQSAYGAFTDWFGSGNPASTWIPQVLNDTLVATNGNVFRRNGKSWSQNTAMNPGTNPPTGYDSRFAYGEDFVIRVTAPMTGIGQAQAEVLAFDPEQPALWVGPTALGEDLPNQSTPADNWPSASGDDWAVVGPYLYFRGSSTNWSQVMSQSATANIASEAASANGVYQSQSLVDAAPAFLTYTVESHADKSVQTLIIANGGLAGAPTPFADQKLAAGSDAGLMGPGVSPQGPGVFAAFPSHYSSFDQAQSLFLHHYAGYAVSGPIEHYTVMAVEMDDGFGDPITTAFLPDAATATADASGNIVKFYQNAVYPGTLDPGSAVDGHVVSRYLNGVTDQTGDNYYDMLDGMLVATETYDASNHLVASDSTTWEVVESVASSPLDASAPAITLRGGWVTAKQKTSMSDGVTSVKRTEYVNQGLSLSYSGQPVTVTTHNFSGAGNEESFVSVTRFGVEISSYPSLVAIHALADEALIVNWQGQGGQQTLLSSNATTYTHWNSDNEGVQVPAPEAGFAVLTSNDPAFPFASYTPGSSPEGWLLSARTTRRTRFGQEAANIDGLSNPSATFYDLKEELAIARIANASHEGCAYLGFQAYESSEGWTLSDVLYDEDDAYSGTRSARLPASANAYLSTVITPDRRQTYVLGCRYRTPASLTANTSGMTINVRVDGQHQKSISLPWADTSNRWQYRTLAVELDGLPEGALTLEIVLDNSTTCDVHLDSVLLTPKVAGATIRSFDPDSQQILSSMDMSGRTSRTYYDRSGRPSVSVGTSGKVREISMSFLSRQGNVRDAFDRASPNAELTLHTTEGGILEDFRDGGQWLTRWQPEQADQWQISNGALRVEGNRPAVLEWQSQPKGTYAVYCELESVTATQISLAAGNLSFGWNGQGWSGALGSQALTALATPPALAAHLLMVVGQGVVLFFADGQLLFSHKLTPDNAQVSLTLGGTGSALRHLTGVMDIRLGLSYNDAGGRQRQVHQLHNDDSLLCELIFDKLDRQVATTKSAPGSFGSGAGVPVLAYRSGFVDVAAFLTATGSDWVMQGDLADYYAGQQDQGYRRSDDEGYPYWGVRYEASPRSVKLETSQPGGAYAINLSVPETERQTVQYAYHAATGADGALPSGKYLQSDVTSAMKTLSSQINDLMGQQVATEFFDDQHSRVNQSAGERSYAAPTAGPVASILQQLPNALTSGPQSGDADYVRETHASALQETLALSDPDNGQMQFIYDTVGNLRFVQPAMGEGEQWFIFYRYDAIGRMVEEGILTASWDTEALRVHADNSAWPLTSTPGYHSTVTIEYDGDGHQPSLLGMKWKTTAINAAPASVAGSTEIRILETFGYDAAGNIVTVTQQVSGDTEASGAIGYSYNQMGDITCLILPDGAPLAKVFYSYDDQGNIVCLGTKAGSDDLASFVYSAENYPVIQTTGDWQRVVGYNSPGWILSMQTQSIADASQHLGFSFDYDADGAMSKRDVDFAFSDFTLSYNDTFGYDGQRRLSRAEGASNVSYDSYDPNGNLWQVTRDGETSRFDYLAGSNRLSSIEVADTPLQTLLYSARGQLLEDSGRQFEYEPATGMTTAVSRGGQTTRLAYGSAQRRVVKQQTGGEIQIDFMGAGQVPVASLINGQWSVVLHGPTGLLAWVADRTYYLLTDTTDSVWGVVADQALISARTYLPFGEMSKVHGTDPVPYGFQGQLWDAELELYDFRTRLYDPQLGRFLTPDPCRQFASGYVFANNSPLIIVDPTGEISIWAEVGIGIAMVAITAVGVGLTLFTGGASDAAAASTDAALLGTATAVEGSEVAAEGAAVGAMGTEAAAEAGTGAAAAGAEGSAAAGASASAEVAAGATATETASTSWSTIGINVLGSTIQSAGTSGLSYDIQHGRDFTAKGFFEAVGIGAATGLVSGGLGKGLGAATDSLTRGFEGVSGAFGKAAINAASGALQSAITSDLKTVLTNVSQHQPWYQGVLKSTLSGAASGAAMGGATSLGKSAWTGREAIAAKAASKGVISDQTVQKVVTLPQTVKSMATSDTAIAGYILAGFFLPAGYVVWGAATNFKTA
ncbi:hypothetical protein BFW38_08750 [Terasakiispira papahanaumokuakeensis]|uniref:Teneurin-like YD-shell domain-containing protein n=1 Tax=Terasakiispira papahanaumokuakeensis TaxID=197479 RepID=A0A1E2V9C4_9GAMM|nr:RHS repeat-associated core domain-containing protein [Terasakiispira papahanaumokuakeensis]ODC03619.1 hypothetical protein BFW38_08750 [Terasakiispira papahanaumokuakeensis]